MGKDVQTIKRINPEECRSTQWYELLVTFVISALVWLWQPILAGNKTKSFSCGSFSIFKMI